MDIWGIWKHCKPRIYSSEFIIVRRAIFMNFVAGNAPIIEENLSPEDVVKLIQEVGRDYIERNKRGISEIE